MHINVRGYHKTRVHASSTLSFILLNTSVRQNKIVQFMFPMRRWALEVLTAVLKRSKIVLRKNNFQNIFFTRKSASIFYKCKPSKFLTSLVCKYDPVQLLCSKSFERILILSSFFSPAATAPIYCPLSHDYHDKEHAQDVSAFQDINQCTNTPVTSCLLSACHGQKRCNLTADPAELKASVCSDHFVYLKTVFACVDMRQ